MKLVLIPVFISLLDTALAAMLQITLPQSLSVREGENVTLPCSFSPPATHLDHIIIQWFWMPRRYAENMTRREMKKIYQTRDEKKDFSIVRSVGDVLTGDCSIGIPNISSSLGPVALCRIDCRRCNAENNEVQGEVLLDVMPAAPQSDGGGVSDATLAPREETSLNGVLVAAYVLVAVLFAISVIIFVFIWMKCRRSSGLCPPSRSGGGNADVPGDVRGDVNGQLLMNGHEEKKQNVLEIVAA
ncbi:uncharacterized protein LOC133339627 [Lethenteron reissneri]|uniref:uncharacterized protein LOC133339627 n=1 Tax=Lethenteron reissneri TaxID=7753 RepID=UPI002AB60153|nr:uncharacterized protein LOC133339627 [Lethenteron reissneri]XP_061403750.1 uncharacterized protein LOC133339627 [Lethenteron reissneri]XP_061403751.1 uncharacterized protein LOC133339627 [Lethenteron reissneri]XP_061403752.1 uncharacterized protein LOC133339627 [Lethenteron reissneri]XP_061403753.1 uncharacterized protein LOC133339627 [Lethenteron reissneri]XP_061403754.1 uncharacterized protein LOC133339627 [Lethenteron reissneri]